MFWALNFLFCIYFNKQVSKVLVWWSRKVLELVHFPEAKRRSQVYVKLCVSECVCVYVCVCVCVSVWVCELKRHI